jgi:phosphoesterase RecJ-like protein
VNSDWDGLGGCIALKLLLEKLGKESTIVLHDLPNEFYRFLEGWEYANKVPEGEVTPVDYAVVLDSPNLSRTGDVVRCLGDSTRILNIDHHKDTDPFGTVNLISTEVSSACEFVYHLALKCDREIDAKMAAQLYTGILFDTGGFRYSLTTPETFEVAAVLVRQGAQLDYIADQLFNNKTFDSVKLIGRAVDSMELHFDDLAATLHLAFEDLGSGDPEDIVNYGLLVRGVKVALLMREEERGKFRVSLRSRDEVDVRAIAAQFGGGGHTKASGCRLEGDLAAVKGKLLEAVKSALP